jgi:hypothetical protein
MTRYTAMNATKFAKKRYNNAQTGLAAGTLFALKAVTTPIQYAAKTANAVLGLQKLAGVKNRKK